MKIKHRLSALACIVLTVLITSMLSAAAAAPSMGNFQDIVSYTPGQFADVDENAWYGYYQQRAVCKAYTLGLMQGRGAAAFNPFAGVTLAEAITMASRLNNIYQGGDYAFQQSEPWYDAYIQYAISRGIIDLNAFSSYTRLATRAEMADIFSRALPAEAFTAINTVNALPDVNAATPYQSSIFLLYRAGVLTGNDAYGSFGPGTSVTRAQAAAIITRIALPSERKAFALTPLYVKRINPDIPVWREIYTRGMWVGTSGELYRLIYAASRSMIPEFEIKLSSAAYSDYAKNYKTEVDFSGFISSRWEYSYQTQTFKFQSEYTDYHIIQGLIFNRSAVLPLVSADILAYDKQIRAILSNVITPGMSDRQKAKAVHDYMVVTYQYDTNYASGLYGDDTYSFRGLLKNNTGVCQAYAELFYLLMRYEGIECYLVTGTADGGTGLYGSHAWNLILVDGNYYHVDVTFDDPIPDGGSRITYTYFLKTESEIAKDHMW